MFCSNTNLFSPLSQVLFIVGITLALLASGRAQNRFCRHLPVDMLDKCGKSMKGVAMTQPGVRCVSEEGLEEEPYGTF